MGDFIEFLYSRFLLSDGVSIDTRTLQEGNLFFSISGPNFNANAFAESWIATVRRECLNHFACFSLQHVDHIVQTFVDYYNEHRPHQGIGNLTLEQTGSLEEVGRLEPIGRIGCRSKLGGLIKHYYRQAA